MKKEFDLVVVGAGINGLAAGCYLQKAGLNVAILEKRNECGPFVLTEDIFRAGVPVDTHAGVCFLPMSPVWGDLELGRFGLDIIMSKVAAGTIWKDRNLLYYFNPVLQQKSLSQFSEKDANTYKEFMSRIAPDLPDILQKAVFSPPSDEGEDFLFSLGKYYGFTEADVRTMNGVELLDLSYENEYVKMGFLGISDIGLFGDPIEKGEGAINTVLSAALAVGLIRGGMHNLVHSLVRCFRHYKGTLLLNAPVKEVIWERGKPSGALLDDTSPYPFKEIKAKQAVIMHTSPPIALEMLGADNIDKKDHELYRKMKRWDMTGHCAFTSYYLIEGLPEWGSKGWNPDVQECPYPLRAWDSWEHAKTYFSAVKSGVVFGAAGNVGEMYNGATVDRTRISKDGCSVLVFEVEYPVDMRRYGGIKAWDNKELTDRLHNDHLDTLESLAPGIKQRVIKSTYFTPIDSWRRNPSAIYGHELGGDASGIQWYSGRMPNRSKIPGLYFSQSVWPPALTHLGSGYVTAGCVAEDLGIRNQPWWNHMPLELLYERIAEIF